MEFPDRDMEGQHQGDLPSPGLLGELPAELQGGLGVERKECGRRSHSQPQ